MDDRLVEVYGDPGVAHLEEVPKVDQPVVHEAVEGRANHDVVELDLGPLHRGFGAVRNQSLVGMEYAYVAAFAIVSVGLVWSLGFWNFLGWNY